MKGRHAAAASAAATMFCVLNAAYAADLDTKAPVLKAPAAEGPTTCTSILDFFATACQVAAYGVRFYGTIDAGFGYQTNASNFGKYLTVGVSYSPGKFNNGARWQLSPNAASQSNIGLLVNEPLGGGWSFVGQLETPLNPYSLLIPSGGKTQHENLNVPLGLETGNNDTNQNGRWWSSEGYFGFRNDTWGNLDLPPARRPVSGYQRILRPACRRTSLLADRHQRHLQRRRRLGGRETDDGGEIPRQLRRLPARRLRAVRRL
jgi:hypothetical protein